MPSCHSHNLPRKSVYGCDVAALPEPQSVEQTRNEFPRMQISPPQFNTLRAFLKRTSGVALDESKKYLVEARLRPLVRQHDFADLDALVQRLQTGTDAVLADEVVCAMMTHETSFFRDRAPFEALSRLIPELVTRRGVMRQLVIWSAACSTGQEPYSLAMLLREKFADLLHNWRVRIIASDLSQIALGRARDGTYSELETSRGLSPAMRNKYFRPLQGRWSIVQDCRSLVEFRQLNLTQPWPAMPVCDVIMLRNVLLYFDVPTRIAVLERMRHHLRNDGALFLGGAETMLGMDVGYERKTVTGCSYYVPLAR